MPQHLVDAACGLDTDVIGAEVTERRVADPMSLGLARART